MPQKIKPMSPAEIRRLMVTDCAAADQARSARNDRISLDALRLLVERGELAPSEGTVR